MRLSKVDPEAAGLLAKEGRVPRTHGQGARSPQGRGAAEAELREEPDQPDDEEEG
jgi:hypothetical protein